MCKLSQTAPANLLYQEHRIKYLPIVYQTKWQVQTKDEFSTSVNGEHVYIKARL